MSLSSKWELITIVIIDYNLLHLYDYTHIYYLQLISCLFCQNNLYKKSKS